jgi:DNA-binding Lrp family transcriptional regulator
MHKKLDKFDFAILRALEADGALTNAAIAEKVGLSTSQCSRRRSALEASGVIVGYHARLDPQAMGRSLRAVVRVNLASHSKDSAREFTSLVTESEEILDAFAVSGDADYVLLVQCADLTAFANFVHDTLLPFSNVGQVKSEIVLRGLK